MKSKISHEQYLKNLLDRDIAVVPLEEYQGADVEILHKCSCGQEWRIKPKDLYKRKRCRDCFLSSIRLSHEEYLVKLEESHIGVVPLEECKGRFVKIRHRCTCGEEWDVTPGNVLSGGNCRSCGNKKIGNALTSSHNEYLAKLHKKGIGVIPRELYCGIDKKILHKCICGNEWEVTPANVLQGKRCKNCQNKTLADLYRMPQEEFIQKVKEHNPNIQIIGDYKGMQFPVLSKCLVCNHKWSPLGTNLIANEGCPVCNASHGEKRISMFLKNNSISTCAQKKYKDLLGVKGGELSYDFYLPNYNLLIEYQGSQHESPKGGVFGGEEQFEIQQEHDRRKREYAKSHNINLLEIWYYDYDNIEQILTEYLNLNSESVETVIPE